MARGKKRERENPATADQQQENDDLGRFAGSSEEEDNSTGSTNSDDEDVAADDNAALGNKDGSDSEQESKSDKKETENAQDQSENGSSDDDDDSHENTMAATGGMANAMARILGAPAKTVGTQSVVLSKTKTPLQKLAEKEHEKEKELKEKRRLNRDRDLSALHVPLSVATTFHVQENSKEITKELEQERVHRRVATRGVVALFNAIAQHQHKSTAETVVDAKSAQVKKMTKHDFLDMIKAKASSTTVTKEESKPEKETQQWNALRDDFMLNPKKNWDEEESSQDELSEGEEEGSTKKQRISSS